MSFKQSSEVLPDIVDIISEAAKLPRDWHASGSLHKAVLEEIARLPPPAFSVETGTGKSTLLLSHMSADHLVFTLDEESHSLDRVRNCHLLGENVRFVIGPSQVTVPQYEFTRPIDIALLDGPHGYPFPELEYYYIYPHIRAGGFLIVDDIHIPTVTRLCEFLRDEEMFDLVSVVRTTAFFKRTEAPLFDPLGDGWWLQGFNKRRYPNLRLSRVGVLGYIKHYLPSSLKSRLQKLIH